MDHAAHEGVHRRIEVLGDVHVQRQVVIQGQPRLPLRVRQAGLWSAERLGQFGELLGQIGVAIPQRVNGWDFGDRTGRIADEVDDGVAMDEVIVELFERRAPGVDEVVLHRDRQFGPVQQFGEERAVFAELACRGRKEQLCELRHRRTPALSELGCEPKREGILGERWGLRNQVRESAGEAGSAPPHPPFGHLLPHSRVWTCFSEWIVGEKGLHAAQPAESRERSAIRGSRLAVWRTS